MPSSTYTSIALIALKWPLIWILKKMDLYSSWSLRRTGPLLEYGWFRSVREQASIDAAGTPLPWITYPAIEFLQRRIQPNMSIFEYGSGGSTLWWANQTSDVESVEHDRAWFEKLSASVPANVTLHHIDLVYGGDYAKKILQYKDRFDVIVVDGRDRVNCLRNCVDALKHSGVIILDNADREEYLPGIEFLISRGFRTIEFVGLSPMVNAKNETAILYRNSNCLGI